MSQNVLRLVVALQLMFVPIMTDSVADTAKYSCNYHSFYSAPLVSTELTTIKSVEDEKAKKKVEEEAKNSESSRTATHANTLILKYSSPRKKSMSFWRDHVPNMSRVASAAGRFDIRHLTTGLGADEQMLGNYVMAAASCKTHPKGLLVPTSLTVPCDTGFAVAIQRR